MADMYAGGGGGAKFSILKKFGGAWPRMHYLAPPLFPKEM